MDILPALMSGRPRRRRLRLLLPLLILPAASPAAAQDRDSARSAVSRWSGQANLNLAGSYGNSGSGSLGVSARTLRRGDRLLVVLDAGLLRTSTDTVRRQAFGSADRFSLERTATSQTSADRSHLRVRVSEPAPERGQTWLRFYAAAGWERDVPAGVLSRYDLTVGLGTSWGETRGRGRRPFEVGAGFSALRQSDEVPDPDAEASSVGLRFDFRGETRVRDADVVVVSASTWNLRNTDDLRLDVTGSVAFPLSRRLAFRTSVQTLFDTRPALERVSLFEDAGGPLLGTVAVSRRRADLILLAALVIRF